MAINQQISLAPPAPQRSNPIDFADKADAFVAWLENLDEQLNQWASECNSTEDNINTLHNETQTYKDQAQQAASDAETYKNQAQQSASDVETYKNQAQQAATESDNNLREFKGRYYGAYSSAPTTDPYGDPIDEGDMYWNTTEKKLYVWDGSQWKVGSIYDQFNADKLDGEEGSYYTNASNLNAGTVPVERLSGTYNIDIDGNAATATNANKLNNKEATEFAYSDSAEDEDLNNITQSGMYKLGENNPNMPSDVQNGQLLVLRGTGNTIAQVVVDIHSKNIYYRSGSPSSIGGSGDWGDWQSLFHSGNCFISSESPNPDVGFEGCLWFQYDCS